jgi:hypothetical protein
MPMGCSAQRPYRIPVSVGRAHVGTSHSRAHGQGSWKGWFAAAPPTLAIRDYDQHARSWS